MVNYKIALLIISLGFISSSWADSIARVINVQTTIDTSNFINYEVTSFVITPSHLNLVYIEDSNSFRDEKVSVSVVTDAPSNNNQVQLNLKSSSLDFTCRDQDKQALPLNPNFLSVYVNDAGDDNQKSDPNDPNNSVTIPSDDSDGLVSSDFNLWFVFGDIPNKATTCTGQVTFNVEIAI